MHGICQIIEKILGLQMMKDNNDWVKAGRIMITFLIVNFTWIFFRMPSLSSAVGVIERFFDFSQPISIDVGSRHIFALMIMGSTILFLKDLTDEFAPMRIRLFDSKHLVVRWLSYVVVIVLIMLTGVFDAGQFIYAAL